MQVLMINPTFLTYFMIMNEQNVSPLVQADLFFKDPLAGNYHHF